MGTEDKKTAAAIAHLIKHGILKKNFKIPQRKSISDKAIMFGSAVAPVAKEMIRAKTKNLTLRKIFLKTIKTKYFNDCLDACFEGAAREAFDNIDRKQHNISKTLVQDLTKVGQFKRFKLVERYCSFDLNFFRAIFEVGYNPKKVVIRKRKYKKS